MVCATQRVLNNNINIKGAYYSNINEVSLPESTQSRGIQQEHRFFKIHTQYF